jgi:glycerol dehydrogenase-like iron-containing ADH family enzyme
MLGPLGGFLAFGPQACALGAAHLIHRLIQMTRDMESV